MKLHNLFKLVIAYVVIFFFTVGCLTVSQGITGAEIIHNWKGYIAPVAVTCAAWTIITIQKM
jgi:hypothetical protein